MRYLHLVVAVAWLCAAAFRHGSGDPPANTPPRTRRVALVKQAIARVAEVGMDKAKPEFMDHGGKYVDRDLYLIIIDKDGMRVVHGQNPKLVGKQYFDAVDVNGKEYGKEVQQIAAGPGKGWFRSRSRTRSPGRSCRRRTTSRRPATTPILPASYPLRLDHRISARSTTCRCGRRSSSLPLRASPPVPRSPRRSGWARPRPRAGWPKSPTAPCRQPRRARVCWTTSTRSRRRRCAHWSGSRPACRGDDRRAGQGHRARADRVARRIPPAWSRRARTATPTCRGSRRSRTRSAEYAKQLGDALDLVADPAIAVGLFRRTDATFEALRGDISGLAAAHRAAEAASVQAARGSSHASLVRSYWIVGGSGLVMADPAAGGRRGDRPSGPRADPDDDRACRRQHGGRDRRAGSSRRTRRHGPRGARVQGTHGQGEPDRRGAGGRAPSGRGGEARGAGQHGSDDRNRDRIGAAADRRPHDRDGGNRGRHERVRHPHRNVGRGRRRSGRAGTGDRADGRERGRSSLPASIREIGSQVSQLHRGGRPRGDRRSGDPRRPSWR